MGDGSTLGMPRFDPKGKSRAATPSNGDILALDLDSAEEGTAAQNGDAFMQMQLVEQQVWLSYAYFSNIRAHSASGHIHPVALDSYRIYRVHHLGARSDIHTTGADGRGATRDCSAHRRRYRRHSLECQWGSARTPEVLREHLEQPLADAESVRSADRICESPSTPLGLNNAESPSHSSLSSSWSHEQGPRFGST